jgi:hypothetical protein
MLGRRLEMGQGEEAFVAQGQTVGLGQYLGTQVKEAFRQTTTGVMIDQMKQRVSDLIDFGGGEEGETLPERFAKTVLTKKEWEESPDFRPGIDIGEGTTRARARIMAANHDEIEARKEILAHKPEGALATALGFGAAIVGSIPDPINLIPFGTVVKGGKALHTIGRAALEGSVGNLAVSAVTRPYWEEQGEESDWQDYAMDAVLGAGVGTLFGVGGAAVRALRKTSTAADRATIARGVEAVAAGENPALVEGLEEATRNVRIAAGLEVPDDAPVIDLLKSDLADAGGGSEVPGSAIGEGTSGDAAPPYLPRWSAFGGYEVIDTRDGTVMHRPGAAYGDMPPRFKTLEAAQKFVKKLDKLDSKKEFITTVPSAQKTRFAPEPEPLRAEAFEPMPRSIEDPDGLLSFVDDKQLAEIEALPREQMSDFDRATLDDADFSSREADKAAEAYARAVDCVM